MTHDKKWPADAVERRAVADLIPYARNARTHSDEQVAQIAASIREWGWTTPVLVDEDGGIIAGHGRVLAAKKLKLAEVPVIIASGWSEAQKRAYVLADNKLTLNGGWDDDLLAGELTDLNGMGFDIDLIGFSQDEFDALMADNAMGVSDGSEGGGAGSLAARFGIPPFTVLNAREGWWQDRKRAWLALGIKSELGRGDVLFAGAAQSRLNEIQREGKKANAEPGGSKMPSTSYAKDKARGDGTGKAIPAGLAFGGMESYDGAQREMTGTSIFDPVMCELAYRWFSPPDGIVVDPFAGGSVRGVVAAKLGRQYVGFELRPEQVVANRAQWESISKGEAAAPSSPATDDPNALTPVERVGLHWVKRDDLFVFNGVPGGKVRSCLALALAARDAGLGGLVTAGSRASPQVNIVAHVGAALGLPVRCHTPQGELSPEVLAAQALGAEIIQHKAGYNTVIVKRARDDAKALGWAEIPFGMECPEAIKQTRRQVANLPAEVTRIVMPCGSGMSLSGVLWGLQDIGRMDVKVRAIVVGADPTERLAQYAPKDWKSRVELIPAGVDYHAEAETQSLEHIGLDPHYEAKCLPFLEPGDLFWIVGIRATAMDAPAAALPFDPDVACPTPVWVEGDSALSIPKQRDLHADFIFSCPPYGDLEVYSDRADDLSTMDDAAFRVAYREIIAAAVGRLKNDRFACFVVGDYRDAKGFYCNFVSETIAAFELAGARLYNEAILVTAVGSLPIRAGKQFAATRKLGKTHQNCLVFCKGDPRKATAACGEVEFGDVGEAAEGAEA